MARRVQQRGRGDDVETWQWVAAIRANGGDVTAQRLMIVSKFIAAEKAAGTWQATDDYWALWAENETQALVSLKQKRLATAVAAPAFAADRGYTSNATTSYINTGFNASTHCLVTTVSNSRLAVYVRANVGTNSTSIGAVSTASIGMRLRPKTNTSVASAQVNSTFTTGLVAAPDARGYTAASRNGSSGAVLNIYKNGTLLETYTPTVFAVGLLSLDMFILANNLAGAPAEFYAGAGQVGFACIGASLTAPQEAAQYNNVQAWATAVGAAV